MSDDGTSSIVVIALTGNVFSPRWARARRRDPRASSLDFSAMNVHLRTRGHDVWALTEHARHRVQLESEQLVIGDSRLTWRGHDAHAVINEKSAPWGAPLRGRVRIVPLASCDVSFPLDPCSLHMWSPRIPVARIEVDFEEPNVSFRGTGYLDMNAGQVPLEETFASWSWSRVSHDARTNIRYDVRLRDGATLSRSLGAAVGEPLRPIAPGTLTSIGGTKFGLSRTARTSAPLSLVHTALDGPFYARSVVETSLDGRLARGIHETVSLDRFRAAWVQFLVPFKMRVATG